VTRILHLSDLHFGAVDDRLVAPLLALAAELSPDATVISGDLSQRARRSQFAAARAFVDRLPGPVLVVPGNHDMPLYNLALRLTRPFAGYHRAFGDALEPCLSLPCAVIQGVNTANPHVWKSGHLTPTSTARLTAAFAAARPDATRIAVLHHAPVPAADGTPADVADPVAVLDALSRAGTEIVLSGHTHMPHAGFAETAAQILFLQVGTAISTRIKTDANDFALIELDRDGVTVRSWLARQGHPFREAPPVRFMRTASGWTVAPA
jgi:3',5'-cyclic AMP phosphodiesterase CpdA